LNVSTAASEDNTNDAEIESVYDWKFCTADAFGWA
jgi:hypothetical protein